MLSLPSIPVPGSVSKDMAMRRPHWYAWLTGGILLSSALTVGMNMVTNPAEVSDEVKAAISGRLRSAEETAVLEGELAIADGRSDALSVIGALRPLETLTAVGANWLSSGAGWTTRECEYYDRAYAVNRDTGVFVWSEESPSAWTPEDDILKHRVRTASRWARGFVGIRSPVERLDDSSSPVERRVMRVAIGFEKYLVIRNVVDHLAQGRFELARAALRSGDSGELAMSDSRRRELVVEWITRNVPIKPGIVSRNAQEFNGQLRLVRNLTVAPTSKAHLGAPESIARKLTDDNASAIEWPKESVERE